MSQDMRRIEPAACRRVFDGELDRRILFARLQRLGDRRRLDLVEIVIAIAIHAELERT